MPIFLVSVSGQKAGLYSYPNLNGFINNWYEDSLRISCKLSNHQFIVPSPIPRSFNCSPVPLMETIRPVIGFADISWLYYLDPQVFFPPRRDLAAIDILLFFFFYPLHISYSYAAFQSLCVALCGYVLLIVTPPQSVSGHLIHFPVLSFDFQCNFIQEPISFVVFYRITLPLFIFNPIQLLLSKLDSLPGLTHSKCVDI